MTHISGPILLVFAILLGSATGAFGSPQVSIVVDSGHHDSLSSMAISPDEKLLVTGSDDRTCKLWDVESGKLLRTVRLPNSIRSVNFSPDGRTILCSSGCGLLDEDSDMGGNVVFWDVVSGALRDELARDSFTIDSACYNSAGTKVFFCTKKEIYIYSASTKKRLAVIHCPFTPGVFALSPDDKKLVAITSSKDKNGTIALYDTSSRALIESAILGSGVVNEARFSPNGKLIALAGDDHTIKLLDYRTLRKVRELRGHNAAVNCIAFSHGSDKLLSGDSDNKIRLWQLNTRSPVKQFTGSSNVVSLSFNKSDTRAFVVTDDRATVLNLSTGNTIGKFDGPSDLNHALAISPDQHYLACGSGKSIIIWDLATGAEVARLTAHKDDVKNVAFTSDNKGLVSCSMSETLIWNIEKQQPVHSVKNLRYWLNTVACSSNDMFACLTDSKTLNVYSGNGESIVLSYPIKQAVSSLCFSPDNTLLAAGLSTGAVLIIDVRAKTASTLVPPAESNEKYTITFSPDGKKLATGGFAKTIEIYDIATRHKEKTLAGHVDAIECLRFNSDGNLLASASDDGTVRLWDWQKSAFRILAGHAGVVSSLAFANHDRSIFSCADDGLIKLWNVDTGAERCSLIPLEATNWAVVDAASRFDAPSLDDLSSVHWTVNNQYPPACLPLEIFMRQYFTPGLLHRVLNNEPLPSVPIITSLNMSQPEVKFDSVVMDLQHKYCDVTVSYRSLVSPKQPFGKHGPSGVYDLRLFRDGQLVGYLPSNTVASPTSTDLSQGQLDAWRSQVFKVRVPNTPSSNIVFTAYAFNDDRIKSKSATKISTFKHSPEPPVRNAFIIAFGVNSYEDSSWNLKCAAADAHSYSTVLKESLVKTKQYDNVISIPLISEDGYEETNPATKQQLECILEILSGHNPTDPNLAAKLKSIVLNRTIGPDDLLIIAFSCHDDADTETGECYLFPSDIGPSQRNGLTADLKAHAISSAELTDWLRDIDVRNLTLIIDACHSAAVVGSDFKPGPMDSRGLGQLAYYKKMRIIGGCRANGVAKERIELGHGLLTYALLEQGLCQGLARKNNKVPNVTMQDLLDFAVAEVPKLDDDTMLEKPTKGVVAYFRPKERTHFVQTPLLFNFSDPRNDFVLQTLMDGKTKQ